MNRETIMSTPTNLTEPVAHKDRRVGLILFGVIEIGIGALCALMVPLLFLALFLAPQAMSSLDRRTVVTAPLMYGAMATILIWLGIGSILCRRWARTLLLIVSWSWLLTGVMAIAFFVWFALSLFANEQAIPIIWISIVITAIFCIAVPGALVLFYQSKHVKATCEARDPVPRWTDTCPAPVLTTSLGLGVGALFLLVTPLTSRNVVPFFGVLLSGTMATMVILACSVYGLYLAWTMYQMKISAWWGSLAAFALFSASGAITFARIDLMEFYRKSGYQEQQIEQIRNLGFFTGKIMAWIMVVFFFLFLIYLLWIKKYFRVGENHER
jgi:MFS family permease